jgi:hypothetical protein
MVLPEAEVQHEVMNSILSWSEGGEHGCLPETLRIDVEHVEEAAAAVIGLGANSS